MKSRLLGILLLSSLTAALFISGCGSNTSELGVTAGKEFTLPVGKTAIVAGEKLSIKFDSMEGDSRCAKGVVCIWAGEAKCTMQITRDGSLSQVTFVDKGGIDGYSTAFYDPYKFSFKLTPYPQAGQSTAPGDYKLVMTVSK